MTYLAGMTSWSSLSSLSSLFYCGDYGVILVTMTPNSFIKSVYLNSDKIYDISDKLRKEEENNDVARE